MNFEAALINVSLLWLLTTPHEFAHAWLEANRDDRVRTEFRSLFGLEAWYPAGSEQQAEVAHLSRVNLLGELSGSLAHELNQPLGAILANAETAELLLRHPSPDLDEVRAILADIRRDDLRAGEIIHGMRALLRRRELERKPVDVTDLVAECGFGVFSRTVAAGGPAASASSGPGPSTTGG